MRKLLPLLALSMTLLGPGAAHAFLQAEFDAIGHSDGVKGAWHVVITQVSNSQTFDVLVTPQTGTSIPGSGEPDSVGHRVSLTFFDPVTAVPVSSVSQATLAPAGTWAGAIFSGVTTEWRGEPSDPALLTVGSSLTGSVTLQNVPATLAATLSVQDGGTSHVWQSGTVTFRQVPEPGSLALSLPLLAPLGFMLRRRR